MDANPEDPGAAVDPSAAGRRTPDAQQPALARVVGRIVPATPVDDHDDPADPAGPAGPTPPPARHAAPMIGLARPTPDADLVLPERVDYVSASLEIVAALGLGPARVADTTPPESDAPAETAGSRIDPDPSGRTEAGGRTDAEPEPEPEPEIEPHLAHLSAPVRARLRGTSTQATTRPTTRAAAPPASAWEVAPPAAHRASRPSDALPVPRASTRPAPGVRATPARPASTDVLFRPRQAARRILAALLLVSVGLAGAAAYDAYDKRTTMSYGIVGIALVLSFLLWAIRVSAQPVHVSIRSGQLEVVRGTARDVFDLTSRYTRLEMLGTPGRHGWKVRLARFGKPPLVIDSSIVDSRAFTEALLRYRPDL